MLAHLVAAFAFAPPVSRITATVPVSKGSSPLAVSRTATPVAIGDFKLPSFDFGGGGDFRRFPDDVSFMDSDGDEVTLRKTSGSRIDFYVGTKIRLSDAAMVRKGNTLEITGKIKKGTPLSLLGFNLEDFVTEGVTPRDPAECDKAMALIS